MNGRALKGANSVCEEQEGLEHGHAVPVHALLLKRPSEVEHIRHLFASCQVRSPSPPILPLSFPPRQQRQPLFQVAVNATQMVRDLFTPSSS
jgi:hypothetical protein